jgi:hypothetical protein
MVTIRYRYLRPQIHHGDTRTGMYHLWKYDTIPNLYLSRATTGRAMTSCRNEEALLSISTTTRTQKMKDRTIILCVVVLTTLAVVSQAFLVIDRSPVASASSRTRLYNTGGWGIGPQRDLTDAEFLRRGGGDRGGFSGVFSGYELQSDFGRNIEAEANALRSQELDELLGVAAAAGIDFNRERGLLDPFADDDDELRLSDDIDVSVDWEVDGTGTGMDGSAANGRDIRTEESITRLDEDTGALGTW